MTLPAIPGDDDLFGLEDLSIADMALPRINILGADGVFEHSLTNETFETMMCVITGLVRQRVLWPPEMGDTPSPPLCRSSDFKTGRPGDGFPWAASGMTDAAGTLSCELCNLKEWNTHPKGDRPWCAEQWHLSIMLVDEEGDMSPALWTVRGSGITPTRGYISGFLGKKRPTFTALTKVTLSQHKRGAVKFSKPIFQIAGKTDPALYSVFKETYAATRTFLHVDRADDDGADGADGTASQLVAAPSTKASKTKVADDTPLEDF